MFIGAQVMMKMLLIACVLLSCLTSMQAQYAEPVNHGGLYVGPRLGIPFVLGMRARYVAASDERPMFYVDAEATTSVLINAVSIGGGLYPLGSTLYVGAKYHSLSTPLVDDPQATTALYSVEVGASIALSSKKSWLLMIDGGPIVNPISDQLNASGIRIARVLPNITLGIVGRLF